MQLGDCARESSALTVLLFFDRTGGARSHQIVMMASWYGSLVGVGGSRGGQKPSNSYDGFVVWVVGGYGRVKGGGRSHQIVMMALWYGSWSFVWLEGSFV
jgi:hypothetical protein